MNLQGLLDRGIGTCIPRTKLFLTVVADAVVSPSLTVTMVVQDESGQHVMMQIMNMKDLQPTVSGLESFPVGDRYCLKNPFLNIGSYGWPLLRVDQPSDMQGLDIPPLQGSIMVLGDGDFSFSASFARENEARGNASITATSLESPEFVEDTYSKGKENLAALKSFASATLLHEIDAPAIGKSCGLHKYDSIVWNFPYPDKLMCATGEDSFFRPSY